MNQSLPNSQDILRARLLNLVSNLHKEYSWELKTVSEIVAVVLPHCVERCSDAQLRNYIVHEYGAVWFDICQRPPSKWHREQVWGEVGRMCYRVAYNRWPDLAQDVAQAGVNAIYQKMALCRGRGTFIGFIHVRLRAAATEVLRKRKGTTGKWEFESFDEARLTDDGDDDDTICDRLVSLCLGYANDANDGSQQMCSDPADLYEAYETQQMMQQLKQWLQGALYHLSDKQRQVLLLDLYQPQLSTTEKAKQLSLSDGNYRVTKLRAKNILQQMASSDSLMHKFFIK